MSEFRKFYKDFSKATLILLLVCAPILLYNTVIDPYGVFWNKYNSSPIEPNKRYLKMNYLLNNPQKYNSFIFGSSRVNAINPAKIKEENYYNMTYSIGTPKEHYEDIQLMLREGIQINNLLIGLDYQSLLKKSIILENDLLRHRPPNTLYEKIQFYKKYLLFRPTTKFLDLSLKKSTHKIDRSTVFTTGITSNYGLDSLTIKQSKSHNSARKFLMPISSNIKHPPFDETFEPIKNLIRIASENNINLKFFINPTHRTTYLNLNIENYFTALKMLADITDYLDFSGLNSVTLNNLNYFETSHFTHKVGDLIIAKMFDQKDTSLPDDFGEYVTQSTLEKHLLLHESLLDDFFWSTNLQVSCEPFIDFSLPTKKSKNVSCTVEKINGLSVNDFNKPFLIFTPWIKVSGYVTGKNEKSLSSDVIVQIGDQQFHTKSILQENDNLNDSIYLKSDWEVQIPVNLLNEGSNSLKVAVLSEDKTKLNIFDEDLKLAIFHRINYQSFTKQKDPLETGEFHIDNINGQKLNYTEEVGNCSYLNIKGWASSKENENSIPGLIVTINGKSYPTQFVFKRNDLVEHFDNDVLKYAGWGVKIPCTDFEEGIYDLSFQVLSSLDTGYWIPKKKFKINFETEYTLSKLDELNQNKRQTKYSIDNINGTTIGTSNKEVIIRGNLLKIYGWAIDFPNEKPASKVFIEINDKLYKTNYGLRREDVMNAYKNASYLNSGWIIEIPVSELQEGKCSIKLKIISNDDKSYYQPNKNISIKII